MNKEQTPGVIFLKKTHFPLDKLIFFIFAVENKQEKYVIASNTDIV